MAALVAGIRRHATRSNALHAAIGWKERRRGEESRSGGSKIEIRVLRSQPACVRGWMEAGQRVEKRKGAAARRSRRRRSFARLTARVGGSTTGEAAHANHTHASIHVSDRVYVWCGVCIRLRVRRDSASTRRAPRRLAAAAAGRACVAWRGVARGLSSTDAPTRSATTHARPLLLPSLLPAILRRLRFGLVARPVSFVVRRRASVGRRVEKGEKLSAAAAAAAATAPATDKRENKRKGGTKSNDKQNEKTSAIKKTKGGRPINLMQTVNSFFCPQPHKRAEMKYYQ